MRAQNDAGQRLSALQRVIALFCIVLLFVGIVLFLSPKVYAHDNVHSLAGDVVVRRTKMPILLTPTVTAILPTPTDTPIVPTPTDTPIVPTPTNTPIIPTPTNTPIPTATATTAPTNTPTAQPTVPKATPTTIAKPTSTSAAGVPPGGRTLPTTPTPTTQPTLSVTATQNSSGLPPAPTDIVSSPTTNTTDGSATIKGQDNGNMLLPTAPEIAIGSSVLAAAALLGWFVWRRRQVGLLPAGYPLAQTPQSRISSPMSYVQTAQVGGSIGMVRENGPSYQHDIANQEMLPETPLSPQVLLSNADASLETIMRQAQMGLFALPDKEEYS